MNQFKDPIHKKTFPEHLIFVANLPFNHYVFVMLGYVEKFVIRPNYCYIRLICIQNYKNTERIYRGECRCKMLKREILFQ